MTTNPESEAGKLRRIEHDPDGVTTEFSVPFRWVEDSDVVVYLIADDATETPTLWLINIDYTLVANADPVDDTGGKIIATTAPTGRKLLIWAETKRSQEVKYEGGGDFPSESHEFALDKNALVDQEDARDLGRALRAPDTDIDQLNDIPPRVARANQALVFDGAGQPAAGGISEKGQLLTSEYGEGLVLVANANAGRSYLSAASAADITSLNAKIDAAVTVGSIRARIDEADLTPTFIPLDGRTIGNASSPADVANDGLRALFDLAKAVPNTGNSGSESFDAGDTVILADLRGRTIIGTGQGTGLTLRNLGDILGAEGNDTVDGATGTGGSVASTAADSNMQPSWAGPWEVYSGALPSLEEINLGQLGIQWNEGGWAAAVDYKRNDALRNGAEGEGESYIALQDHTSTANDEPGVGVNWQTFWAVMNYDGSPGGVGNWRGAWGALTPYVTNDAVEHQGSSWIANAGSTGSEPGVGAEWDLQAAKGDDGAPGAPGEVQAVAVQDGRHLYLTNIAGTGNDITAQANPTLTAWTEGQRVVWKVGTANDTGKMTMVVDGLAAIPIQDRLGGSPPSGFYAAGSMAEAVYDGANLIDLSIPVNGAAGAARGHIQGLVPSNAAENLNKDIRFSAGMLIPFDSDQAWTLASSLRKQGDVAFSEGDGGGGLGNGVTLPAGGNVYMFAITKDTDGTPDIYMDTDAGGANPPTGWTVTRRVWKARTNASNNFFAVVTKEGPGGAIQVEYKNKAAVGFDLNTSTLSTTPQTFSIAAPPNVDAKLRYYSQTDAGNAGNIYPVAVDDETPSFFNSPLGNTLVRSGSDGANGEIFVDSGIGSQVKAVSDAASTILRVQTVGWTDARRD